MENPSLLEAYSAFRREVALLVATETKTVDFGHKQMLIFIRLSQGPATMGELSIFTQSDKAATTRAIQSLENESWVKKTEDPNDRRSAFIELTASGRKKAAQAMKIRSNIGVSLDRTLSVEKRRELCSLLEEVVVQLQSERGM